MGADDVSPPSQTFTEVFESVCPYFMSIGMSVYEFWDGEPRLARYYAEAHRLRNQQQNQMMWVEGLYFREALASTVGNMFLKKGSQPLEYPQKPFLLDESEQKQEDKEQEEMLAARDHMDRLMTSINARMGVKKNGTDRATGN